MRLMGVVGPVWWGWGGQSRSAAEFLDIRVWGENWWKEFTVNSGCSLIIRQCLGPVWLFLCRFLHLAQTFRSSFILDLVSVFHFFFLDILPTFRCCYSHLLIDLGGSICDKSRGQVALEYLGILCIYQLVSPSNGLSSHGSS